MNHTITIKDKVFKPFLKHDDMLAQVKRMAQVMNEIHKNDFPIFLVILNGAFMFASDLLKEVKVPCEISFVKLSSYQGTQSTNTVKEIIGLNESIENRQVIVVEDIVDTGYTIKSVYHTLLSKKAKDIKIATALYKPTAYKSEIKIDYIGFEIPDNFVVGYGLDYDGLGRNLKDLYVLA